MDSDRKALPQAPDAIELRHLRAFVAVADELSFSKAAQRLFITQPALSRQIRGLERLVGCDLFRRSTQRVDLTLAGESLLVRARALLADLDNAINETRSVGGELAGRMALLWEPWVHAYGEDGDVDEVRAAVEELHGRFAPPPGVTVASAIAGGVPERGLPLPAAAVLLCPWVDLDGRTQRPPQDSPILFSPEQARRFARAYLAGQHSSDPVLSPLHTDLAGLPPMLIHAASGDSVLHEAQLLAKHAEECGVSTTITIYPVPTHDFHIFWSFLPEAIAALEQAGQFIRAVAGPHSRAVTSRG